MYLISGDISQKKFICSDADTTTIELDGTEDYLILACDGLWDVMDFDMAVKEVYDHVQSVNGDLRSTAKHLVITARDLGSSDNITVTVVFFKHDISPPEIPQLFNFGVSESQGKSDSAGSDLGDKGNNSDQQNEGNNDSNSTSQSDNNTSGNVRNKENQENNIFEDDDQTVFISSNENHYQYLDYKGTSVNGNVVDGTSLSPRKPLLTRNEPIFIIESTQERQRQHLFSSPIKLENQHSTISGFRRHYDNVSVADLRDFSVDIEKHNKNNSKFDISKNEDIKENIAESENSLNSGYLSNSNKHSEPFYNKSMFSPRRKHHRRKSKDSSHQESDHDTKRSRRHRELSPIVWNFTGSTKPSVNNYKLTYSKTSSNSTPRFSIHSHGNLSETPISVRKSLPDLSGIDKHRSTRVTHDSRYLENGVLPLAQSINVSHTLSQLSKLDSNHPQLPKIKLNGTQSTSHSNSKFPSTWKPRKPGRTVSGNLMDVPPSPLLNQRLHHDRPN
jgi:protein phosphatase 1E